MALKNQYLIDLLETVKKRNPSEPEFIQAVTEVLETLQPVAEKRQDLIDAGVFDRIVEPERQMMCVPLRKNCSNSGADYVSAIVQRD